MRLAAEVVLVGATMSSNEFFSSKLLTEPRTSAESPILQSTLEKTEVRRRSTRKRVPSLR
jgi:hypothetical protein